MRKLKTSNLLALALAALAPNAGAGNDAYFVTYNHHIEKGEWEVMVMNDFTWPSKFKRQDDGLHSYFSNMIELEYGITEQWAAEIMLEGFEEVRTGKVDYTGERFETRYRLFKEDVPFNPVLYAEFEHLYPNTRFKMETSGWVRPPYHEEEGPEPDRERILESRLVLSQDFGAWNVAFNWINETDLDDSGFTAFGYSMGVRYDFNGGHYGHHEHEAEKTGEHGGCHHHGASEGHEHKWWMPAVAGVEMYGGLGDLEKFGLSLSRQEHYVQPLMMWHLSKDVMFHVGFAVGLSKASDNLIRTAFAIEF
ncbi:MAG: hypothetical protein HZA91_09515 [Verrucomicrobia bacterium]|nr:hypothetical protein [Verrucomicrobiota bacterium]